MTARDRAAAVRGTGAGARPAAERSGAQPAAERSGARAAPETVPGPPDAPPGDGAGPAPSAPVRDLRGRADAPVPGLVFADGDLVVVSGLPGSGKSTLIRRVTGRGVNGADGADGADVTDVTDVTDGVDGVDSQDARERWAGRLPGLPYTLYRPVVRLAHYAGLRRLLRSGRSAVVHDCGTQTWVRRWLAREARGRGRRLHLVLLDVAPEVARAGQRARGRGVSRYAFARHRRAVARLLAAVESARLPAGCDSAVLLDRDAAASLRSVVFAPDGSVRPRPADPGR